MAISTQCRRRVNLSLDFLSARRLGISYVGFPADFCQPPVALLNILYSLKPSPISISHLQHEVIDRAFAFSSQTDPGTCIVSLLGVLYSGVKLNTSEKNCF